MKCDCEYFIIFAIKTMITMNRLTILLLSVMFSTSMMGEKILVDGIYYQATSSTTAKVMHNSADEDESGGIVIIGLNNGYDGDVTIPSTITYDGNTYTVTSAETGAFSNSTKMTSITLPATLTELGPTPFTSCGKLNSITVDSENPMYSTEDGVLFDKTKSTIISCPGAKTGAYVIPSSVSKIEKSAFYGCSKLTSIELPSTVNDIGEYAFRACISLKSINIPEGITEMKSGVLRGCSSLPSLTLPSTLTMIDDYALYYCQSLSTITVPEGVKYVGDYAFSSCVKLTNITLPNSLEEIGNRVFESCTKLGSLTIPTSLQHIGRAVFRGCTSLISIEVPEACEYFSGEEDMLFNKAKTTIICCPCKKEGHIELPSTVKTVDDYAFYMCRSVTGIKFSPSLTTIGYSAFSNCTGLHELVFPNTLRNLGKSAFISCTALESITSYAYAPPINDEQCFSSKTYEVPLYVPQNAIPSYQNSDEWEKFTLIYPIAESLTATSSDSYPGATARISIGLNNAQNDISSYQFDMHLPEGMSLIPSANSYIHEYTARHSSSDPVMTATDLGGGNYRLHFEADATKKISGNEGDVVSFLVALDKEVPTGTHTGTINEGFITYKGNEATELSGTEFQIEVKEGLLGDANIDGTVDIVDVMLIVKVILANVSDNYIWQLSDINHDGQISVIDVMEIVNIILYE